LRVVAREQPVQARFEIREVERMQRAIGGSDGEEIAQRAGQAGESVAHAPFLPAFTMLRWRKSAIMSGS
jgi:hypothetical protein